MLAVVPSLAACGAGHGAATTSGGSDTKIVILRLGHPAALPIPDIYMELRGPSSSVEDGARFAQARIPRSFGRLSVVSKAHGPEACSFRAGQNTIRLYGNKNFAPALCKDIHKNLGKGLGGG